MTDKLIPIEIMDDDVFLKHWRAYHALDENTLGWDVDVEWTPSHITAMRGYHKLLHTRSHYSSRAGSGHPGHEHHVMVTVART
jgi:hypothetical protein